MKEIDITTGKRTEFIDCFGIISEVVREWDMTAGVITVFVPHTTAGITINENADPDVMADMTDILDNLIAWRNGYRHAEGNTAAHVKASMMGSSVQLIVENGEICRGIWQGVYFCEFDGPRQRKLWVSKS